MDEEFLDIDEDMSLRVIDVEKNIAVQLKALLETPICDLCCDYPELCNSDIIPVCGCEGFDHREEFLDEESEL